MANTRAIVKRRRAVRNIHKITRTMGLIATSRFRKAHDRAVASRPYADKLAALAGDLAAVAGGRIEHPLLAPRVVTTDLLLVLTSNRGLCGGYNAAVQRAAMDHYNAQRRNGRQVRVEIVGKKGLMQARFLGLPVEAGYTHFDDRPKFEDVDKLANRYMELFTAQAVDSVHVAYTRFVSAGVQQAMVTRLLPFENVTGFRNLGGTKPSAAAPAAHAVRHGFEDFDFSPDPQGLLAELLPACVRVQLFQCFMDAAVSEQVARMRAMKAATENAEDMIRLLTQRYNRARQANITSELSEIIGGAAAIS